MDKFANLLKPGSTVRALWLENKPDLVKGLVGSIKRRTSPTIECLTVTSAESFRRHFNPSVIKAVVLDIKIDGPMDGITVARKVRDKYKGIPIHFMTSYAPEYAERLRALPNVNGVHYRATMDDQDLAHFQQSLAKDAYAYAAFTERNVSTMTWDAFLASNEQDAILAAHERVFGKFATEQLIENQWAWLVIAGDEVREGSSSMHTFPTLREKEGMASRFGRVPFVYARPIVSEESFYHSYYVNHYPRLQIQIDGKGALADLDTGTNQTVVSDAITKLEPASLRHKLQHLGEEYWYGVNSRDVTFSSADAAENAVGPVRMPVAIVEKWSTSPWVRVNPQREALVGRDLFALHSVAVRIESSVDRSRVTTWVLNKTPGD